MGGCPRPQVWIVDFHHLGRKGEAAGDGDPLPKLLQSVRAGLTLHLRQIAPTMSPSGVGQTTLEPAVIGEQQQAFTVGVETASGVDPGTIDVGSEAGPPGAGLGGELTQHPVRLVEKQCGQLVSPPNLRGFDQVPWRVARQRLTTPMEISNRPRSIEAGGRIMKLVLAVTADPIARQRHLCPTVPRPASAVEPMRQGSTTSSRSGSDGAHRSRVLSN